MTAPKPEARPSAEALRADERIRSYAPKTNEEARGPWRARIIDEEFASVRVAHEVVEETLGENARLAGEIAELRTERERLREALIEARRWLFDAASVWVSGNRYERAAKRAGIALGLDAARANTDGGEGE